MVYKSSVCLFIKRCASLSDHIMQPKCSHTLVTQESAASLIPMRCGDQRWLLATTAAILQGKLTAL